MLTEVTTVTDESASRSERLRQTLANREAYDAARISASDAASGATKSANDASASLALAALAIRMAVDEVPADAGNACFVRCLELLNKTNQFNLNGLRLAGEALEQLLQAGSRLFALEVSDKYTAHGLVGVALVNPQGVRVQLAISCRVLGLQLEGAFLSQVMAACALPRLVLYYRATDKNFPLTAWIKSSCEQHQGLYQLSRANAPAHLAAH